MVSEPYPEYSDERDVERIEQKLLHITYVSTLQMRRLKYSAVYIPHRAVISGAPVGGARGDWASPALESFCLSPQMADWVDRRSRREGPPALSSEFPH